MVSTRHVGSLCTAFSGVHRKALDAQLFAERFAQRAVIFDKQYSHVLTLAMHAMHAHAQVVKENLNFTDPVSDSSLPTQENNGSYVQDRESNEYANAEAKQAH